MSDFGPVSLSELTFYSGRAALGAGCPHGVAEDVASTAVWLAKKGVDPTPTLTDALDNLVNKRASADLKKTVAAGNIKLAAANGRPCSAIYAGIAASDQLALIGDETGRSLIIKNTDSPILAAAFASALSLKNHTLNMRAVCNGAGPAVLSLAGADFMPAAAAGDLILKMSAAGGQRPARSAPAINDHHNIPVNRAGWDGLLKHFKNSLVAASEESRLSGAGAGLVDTD